MECLLPFGAESFVFRLTILKIKIKTIRNMILPVVLHECETWSFILVRNVD
jgi:hypothetical protein